MDDPAPLGRPPVTLPATSVALLADVLAEVDEFLRSGDVVLTGLADFLASRGRQHPRYDACTMIDEVSFAAAWLRGLTGNPDQLALSSAHHGQDR